MAPQKRRSSRRSKVIVGNAGFKPVTRITKKIVETENEGSSTYPRDR